MEHENPKNQIKEQLGLLYDVDACTDYDSAPSCVERALFIRDLLRDELYELYQEIVEPIIEYCKKKNIIEECLRDILHTVVMLIARMDDDSVKRFAWFIDAVFDARYYLGH